MKTVNLLIKPSSDKCNMRCKYCFYHDISQKHKNQNLGFMTTKTLENIIKKAFCEAKNEVCFTFQGGEPTLIGLDFYENLVKLQKKLNDKNLKIDNRIQTNGFLIDEQWAKFLSKNNFLVGISLDGTKDVHDAFRLDAGEKGTFNKVLKTIELLKKHKVDFNILTVVTSLTARKPEAIYNFYKKNGFKYLQFIPCLNPLGKEDEKQLFTLSPKRYGDFLCTLFDLWYRDFKAMNYISIGQFDNYIMMLNGQPAVSCGFAGVCSIQNVIEADGSVYPCDFYVLDELKLGNINENSFDEINAKREGLEFIEKSQSHLSECQKCEYFAICRGGCKRYKEPFLNGEYSQNVFCESYKQFFKYALPRMVEIAKNL
ncbi:MAG: anaerobic sulfatase maturase [Oscillospiraceae bacterium]